MDRQMTRAEMNDEFGAARTNKVGMIGCKHEKRLFLRGYNKMLETIEPSAIICLGEPFSEMKGNIIAVNYLDSRKVVR